MKLNSKKYKTRKEFKKIYIFTEGEGTEPIYFNEKKKEVEEKQFRRRRVEIFIRGTKLNTTTLVEYALRCIREESFDLKIDECWVVFDKDNYGINFDEAIRLAQKEGLRAAYSNECFELWFLLHFIPLNSAISRDDYNKKITQNLKKITRNKSIKYYKKFNIYSYIKDKEMMAIKNAESLLKGCVGKVFSKQNPSTTVHLLVKSLNDLKIK